MKIIEQFEKYGWCVEWHNGKLVLRRAGGKKQHAGWSRS